jgi:hypothetical protein
MLIEDVEIVFLQVVQELFGLHRQEEGTVRVLRELLTILSPHIQVLLGIGSNPIGNQTRLNSLLKDDIKELL